jgi:hypothetical protein
MDCPAHAEGQNRYRALLEDQKVGLVYVADLEVNNTQRLSWQVD